VLHLLCMDVNDQSKCKKKEKYDLCLPHAYKGLKVMQPSSHKCGNARMKVVSVARTAEYQMDAESHTNF